MAKHGISRRSSGSDILERANPPAHDTWGAEHLTGLLELSLRTLPGVFVAPGTGRLSLVPQGDGEVVAQGAAKAAGKPVIPGSGIKGAVRTHYEILSDSCDPHARGACQANIWERRFSDREYCEACSLFGCMGWRGRVSFSDAIPAEPGAVQEEVLWVATPWEPDASKTGGDFRLYDLDRAVVVDTATDRRSEAPKDLAREAYQGRFITRLNFWNATAQELGRLLLAMGLAVKEQERFPVRLGGSKYDGQGAMSVEPVGARLASPERVELDAREVRERCISWIGVAESAPWYELYRPKLRELGEISRPRTE